MNKRGAPHGNQNAVKPDEEKLTSFLHIKALPENKSSWVRAAQRKKMKLSKWVTETLNKAAQRE